MKTYAITLGDMTAYYSAETRSKARMKAVYSLENWGYGTVGYLIKSVVVRRRADLDFLECNGEGADFIDRHFPVGVQP